MSKVLIMIAVQTKGLRISMDDFELDLKDISSRYEEYLKITEIAALSSLFKQEPVVPPPVGLSQTLIFIPGFDNAELE